MNRYISAFEDTVKPYTDIIFNFLDKHWYFTFKISQIICIWLIVCLASVIMLGAIGFDTVNKNIEERHTMGTIPIQEYNNWHFVSSIIGYIFWTLQLLAYIIIAIMFYIIYKFMKKIEEIRNNN